MRAPGRPLLRWHGGKWLLAPWIIAHFPKHRCYVEPFGGAFSVGLRKPRTYAEIWNDLDCELVNLMRVLRDPRRAPRLIRELELTPFARTEFEAAYPPARSRIERARRLLIRSFMGFSTDATGDGYRTGFRCKVTQQGTTPARDWAGYPPALRLLVDRLSNVTLEHRPALEILARFDGPETLFYIDPPYLPETRGTNRRRPGASFEVFTHELQTPDHVELLSRLIELEGMVILSGYPSKTYDAALIGWRRVERRALAEGARPRVEVLWINPAAVLALGDGPLFEAAAAA